MHPQYQVGTKLLLGIGIYNDDVPEKVIDHMFVYKIVELYPKWHDSQNRIQKSSHS
jgi:hypothetical protein